MTARLARKSSDNSSLSSEAEKLQHLREEASKITRLLEAGKISNQEATRRLNALVTSNVSFSYRVFGF